MYPNKYSPFLIFFKVKIRKFQQLYIHNIERPEFCDIPREFRTIITLAIYQLRELIFIGIIRSYSICLLYNNLLLAFSKKCQNKIIQNDKNSYFYCPYFSQWICAKCIIRIKSICNTEMKHILFVLHIHFHFYYGSKSM